MIVFRVIVAAVFVTFILHRGYYHRRQPPPPAGTAAPVSSVPTRLANLLALPGLAAVVIYVTVPTWLSWAAVPFPDWLRWLGVAAAAVGFALLQWAQVTLAGNWSSDPRLLKGQTLTTTGPYRWIRHPIYTAFLLILGSPLLISASWAVGLPWLLMTAMDIAGRIRREEALLQKAFGHAYAAYRRRTGALVPRLGRRE